MSCSASRIELADPVSRQGTGYNATGGSGPKRTKLCDKNFDAADSVLVELMTEDALVKGNALGDSRAVTFCAPCSALYAARRAELGCALCANFQYLHEPIIMISVRTPRYRCEVIYALNAPTPP